MSTSSQQPGQPGQPGQPQVPQPAQAAGHEAAQHAVLAPVAALVRVFVHHRTAANLLMALLILAGVLSLGRLNTQFFPTVDIPQVSITVTWEGATPADMEKMVIRNLEPAIRALDGLDTYYGVAREGWAYISLTFVPGTDMTIALSEVKKAVDSATTLPEDIDPPQVKRVVRREVVAKLLLTGPYSEKQLKAFARRIRDAMLDAGIERITMTGARREEIVARIPTHELVRLDLDLSAIAARVRNETRDIPAGDISGAIDKSVHGAGRARSAAGIAEVPVKTLSDGTHVRLGEVARIEEGFDPTAERGFHEGRPAIQLIVWRTPTADTLKTNALFEQTLNRLRSELPADLVLHAYDVRARYLKDRIEMLLRNGAQGLALVLVILFLFLNGRIAFWVAVGIPTAMMATLAIMWATGQSINMISLFALILTLGIIVDDAIVVAEHSETLRRAGLRPLHAAEQGALRMLAPVSAATLTTMAAFLPLFFFQGRIGHLIIALPLVVISVLAASLIESFFVLPAHLRHALRHAGPPSPFRQRFDAAFERLKNGAFQRLVALAYDFRYATWALAIAALMLALALPFAGHVRFHFFPVPETEFIRARIVMAAGTPQQQTLQAVATIERTLHEVAARLGKGERVVDSTFVRVGRMGFSRGDHLAQIDVQLTPSEERTVRTRALLRAWKKALPPIPGLERISFGGRHMAGAPRDLVVELKGDDPFVLKRAAEEVAALMKRVEGLIGIEDDLPYGKRDVRIALNAKGEMLGHDLAQVSGEVRAALLGTVARKFAREQEEVALRIRRDENIAGSGALAELPIRGPDGAWRPLGTIATLEEAAGFTTIYRRDGKISVSVEADIDEDRTTLSEAIRAIKAAGIDTILHKYGITASFSGGAEEQRKNLSDFRLGIYVALALIYIVLALIFDSYSRPLIIMSIIPFGVIGAIVGHWLLGYALTILSLIALLGLSGILVNDSIILVARADERRRHGEEMRAAAIGAAKDRLRAVILTSLTTIGGLTPLLFETSLQAQFLIPMAITIVFGLMVSTLLVLFLVPATLGIAADAGRLVARLKRLLPRPAAAE